MTDVTTDFFSGPVAPDDLPQALLGATRGDARGTAAGYPALLRRLRQARHAILITTPPTAPGDPPRASLVELGGMGLQGWTTGAGTGLARQDPGSLLSTLARGAAGGAGRTHARRFLACLDHDILSALRRAHLLEAAAYNWAAVDPERRCAAIRSYPPLARSMPGARAVESTLAFGGSLEDALALDHQVSRDVIRDAASAPPSLTREGSGIDSGQLLDQLTTTPPHLRPCTPSTWRDWAWLVKSVQGGLRHFEAPARTHLIADTLARPGWRADVLAQIPETTLAAALQDLGDALRALIGDYLVPMAIASGRGSGIACRAAQRGTRTAVLMQQLALQIAGRAGLPPLLAFSRAWHRRAGAGQRPQNDRIAAETPLPTPGLDPIQLPGGIRAEPIVTAGALRAEGAEMRHCLGAVYLEAACLGEVAAYRLAGPELRATVTLRLDAMRWAIDDARGVDNAEAPAIQAAAQALARELTRQGAGMPRRPEAERAVQAARGIDGMLAEPEIACARARAAHAFYQPMLPKRLRVRGWAEMCDGAFASYLDDLHSPRGAAAPSAGPDPAAAPAVVHHPASTPPSSIQSESFLR